MTKNKKLSLQFKNITFVLFCSLACATISIDSAMASDGQEVIVQARELQAAGKVKQAYQLMQKHADDNAGLFEYDYLLGQLAMDSGKPVEAIFVLERALDQRPNFAPARAELARAYFIIGENKAARNEFEKVQKAEMPAASKKLMARYILAIDDRLFGNTGDTSFYVSAGIGYDTNVNTSPSTRLVALPTGTIELSSPEDREKDSSAATLQGGGRFSYALKSNLQLYGGGDLRFYQLFDEDKFSTQIFDGVLGLHLMHGRDQYKLALVGQKFALDGKTSRNLFGMNAQWLHAVNAANQLSVFGQYAAIRFPVSSLFDINQLSAGATWLHLFENSYQPIMHLTAYAGKESEQASNADYVGRDYFGLRAGVRVKTSAKIIWSGVVSYQKSKYGGVFPFTGGVVRDDDFVNTTAAVDYEINKTWRITPEITYSKSTSNLGFFDYDRLKTLVTVRVNF
jgi:hypothetical protein